MGKAPISPSHLSRGAETEMKRQSAGEDEGDEPPCGAARKRFSRLAKKKKAHLHAEREAEKSKSKQKKRSVSSCFINKLQGEY